MYRGGLAAGRPRRPDCTTAAPLVSLLKDPGAARGAAGMKQCLARGLRRGVRATAAGWCFAMNDRHSRGGGTAVQVRYHEPDCRPVASPRTVRADGETQLEEIALVEEGGTVLVRVLDMSGSPATDIQVVLLADPAGYRTEERGSILLSRAFSQQDSTSRFGNVRFTGVPPGRIRLHAMSPQGQAWTETRVDEKQILEIALDLQ